MGERAITSLASVVFVLALVHGARTSADAHAERADEREALRTAQRFGRSQFLGASGGAGGALPGGLRVDPATGLLIGTRISVPEGTRGVPWEVLRAFDYSKAQGLDDVPESIKSLDGQRVAMMGFLWANYDVTDIRQFGLVGSHWSCCYGMPPGLSDVVDVTLTAGSPGLERTRNPVRVEGIFHVNEARDPEFDHLMSIYQISDATVTIIEY
jgi:hypothetical protein